MSETFDELGFEKSFEINEPIVTQEAKRAFTHSSTWVGNVRYDTNDNSMVVKMNGKSYNFCDVPQRVFDSWEGASSKGEFWWRNVKDRFNCSSAVTETELHDVQWPPETKDRRDTVDVLMLNYSPDTGRPDGIVKESTTPPSACGNCKFYVDGGACAIVEGPIDPIRGICKFYEAGQTLPYNTQVFPVYAKVEAEYRVMSNEPYLKETQKDIIDRKNELESNGTPENEIEELLSKEFGDTSIVSETIDNYTATGAKINSEPSMHNEHGHQITNPKVRDYENENPNTDALIFDIPPLYNRAQKETKLIRETIGELSTQFNWMTPDYLQRISELGRHVGGRFVLVRASAEAITDHRSEGEPYRRLLKGDELAQLTRTGISKKTDINHLGKAFEVDSDVLDAEYDPIRKESQMLVHLRDPEIIHYIETGQIQTVSINAGAPRHMSTECGTGECFVVPRGLMLGELDGIAFTWVVNDPNGILWKGKLIPRATPGVKTTKIELL